MNARAVWAPPRPGLFFMHLPKTAGMALRLFLGNQSRKANWAFRSLTGTEAEAVRAEEAVGRDLARDVLGQVEADPDPDVARWLAEIGGLLAAAVGLLSAER